MFEGLADADADAEIGWLVQLISEVRSVRSEMNVPAGAKIPLVLVGAGKVDKRGAPSATTSTIKRLARLDEHLVRQGGAERLGADRARRGDGGAAAGRRHRHGRGAGTALAREIDKTAPRSRRSTAKLANEIRGQGAAGGRGGEPRAQDGLRGGVHKLQAALEAGRGGGLIFGVPLSPKNGERESGERAMYTPAHFKVEDAAEAHALMRAHPFAILVTHGSDGV